MARPPGFKAQYPSICARCNCSIVVGDRVVRHRHGVIHTGCASGQDDE